MTNFKEYKVHGAGLVRLSSSAHSWTGGAVGFSIGVSWGIHGYSGGVMSRTEALKLANHIIKACSECDLSEDEELGQNMIRLHNGL